MDKLLFAGSSCVICFIACGGGSNNNKQPDAHPGSGGSAVCTASSSYGAASIVGSAAAYAFTAAEITSDGSAGFLDANQGLNGNINSDALPDGFEIDLYEGFGAFPGSGSIKTGNVTLSGDDLSFQMCGLCLQIYTNIGSDGSPTDLYFATGGSIDLTSVGSPTGSNVSTGTLAGMLSNVAFAHWDGSADKAFGDCNSSITSLSFTGTLVPVSDGFEGGPTRIIGRRTR